MTGKLPLACFGAEPKFREVLSVGQSYSPEWKRYESAARDIFSRRYYVSQRAVGPLVVQMQRRLREFLGVAHALPVGSAAIGLMIATHTLGLRGRVLVPNLASCHAVDALVWSDCQPVFCDIDGETQQMSIASARTLLREGGINGILGVHLWGGTAPVQALQGLADEFQVPLYYDAAHAFGCRTDEKAIGGYGRAEVFSFHAANILSTGEGGCVATNDDALAGKFRAMRGDHVTGGGVAVQSATARMSEIQAAVGLMMLDDFELHRRNNQEQHRRYEKILSGIAGIKVFAPAAATQSNFQNLIVSVDQELFGLSRDELLAILKMENVQAEPVLGALSSLTDAALLGPFQEVSSPNARLIALCGLQMPIGAKVSVGQIDILGEIFEQVHVNAELIKSTPALLAAN
jgi:dTDP-4-amino-4,6-dideoxygalactose transaminase